MFSNSQGIDHDARGVIHCQQQCELPSPPNHRQLSESAYLPAAYADAELGAWVDAYRADCSRAHQQTSQRAASYVYALVFFASLICVWFVPAYRVCARCSTAAFPISYWALCDLDDRERVRLLHPSCMPPECATYGVCSLPSA